jgi:hypothetical protein
MAWNDPGQWSWLNFKTPGEIMAQANAGKEDIPSLLLKNKAITASAKESKAAQDNYKDRTNLQREQFEWDKKKFGKLEGFIKRFGEETGLGLQDFDLTPGDVGGQTQAPDFTGTPWQDDNGSYWRQ